MDTTTLLIQNLLTIVGGIVVASGMTVLDMYKHKKENGNKCINGHCSDHSEISKHIIESKIDIQWIKEKLKGNN